MRAATVVQVLQDLFYVLLHVIILLVIAPLDLIVIEAREAHRQGGQSSWYSRTFPGISHRGTGTIIY